MIITNPNLDQEIIGSLPAGTVSPRPRVDLAPFLRPGAAVTAR